MELWSFHSGRGSHYEQQQLTTTFFSLTLSILLDESLFSVINVE